jgi:hypothetical protein
MGTLGSAPSNGDDNQPQLSLPHVTSRSITAITQLLLSSEDPLVLSSGLAAYAASCDTALRISGGSSEPLAEDLMSWLRGEDTSCGVMKVMIRCFYFPAVHTVCVAAIRAMQLVCTSLLNHYHGSTMDEQITSIVFPMLQLVLDTSQRSTSSGGSGVTLECDQMNRFSACMSARLSCVSTFPWLLLFARMNASDCHRNNSNTSSRPAAAATASTLHRFMMRSLSFAESSIFALEPKTRSDHERNVMLQVHRFVLCIRLTAHAQSGSS